MMQRIRDGFRHWFTQNKDTKRRVFVALGVVGILLIGLSEWLPHSERDGAQGTQTLAASEVEAALEQRIAALIERVDGVGNCRVMVTLESGSRFVYAAEQTYSQGSDTYSSSEKTLFVDTENGPVGLLLTEVQPTVKGVAVVCDGGDDRAVREQVTGLVSAAFNISSGRVCVAKHK
ncbi:MAG: hypothetical protein IJB26_05030 [Clostridia bacterium]|nr:hypothetical protein [Clostridia bacterium]